MAPLCRPVKNIGWEVWLWTTISILPVFCDSFSLVSVGVGQRPYDSTRTLSLSLSSSSSVASLGSPREWIQQGMSEFRQGHVTKSIECFDKAEQANPSIRPYLWQRGISYYYDDRFAEGSQQFRNDVAVNPLDVEEIVWDIACQLRLVSRGDNDDVSKSFLSLPAGQSDRRKIMATVYSLFRNEGGITEHDLAKAGEASPAEEFYSLFYLGLYCEVQGEESKASYYMKAAASTPYAQRNKARGDYMTMVAQVHCQLREWL